jgi:1-acyl-sn-glycerol-3-phosphate acyltransferase
MTIVRSAIFLLWFALVTAMLAIIFLPALLLPRSVTVWMARQWCALTLWGLDVFAGLDFEVRGTAPQQGMLVASKHMSMWDTLALYVVLDDPAMIIKRELLRVPFYGWYLWKAGSIAIDRDGRASALRRMAAAATKVFGEHRSVIIFPEGTRKKPGMTPDYKPGVAALYGQLGTACAPVALNSGLFWTGPMGFVKKRGRIVVEFLPSIPAGLKRQEFMATLEERIESKTAVLVEEGRALLSRNH